MTNKDIDLHALYNAVFGVFEGTRGTAYGRRATDAAATSAKVGRRATDPVVGDSPKVDQRVSVEEPMIPITHTSATKIRDRLAEMAGDDDVPADLVLLEEHSGKKVGEVLGLVQHMEDIYSTLMYSARDKGNGVAAITRDEFVALCKLLSFADRVREVEAEMNKIDVKFDLAAELDDLSVQVLKQVVFRVPVFDAGGNDDGKKEA